MMERPRRLPNGFHSKEFDLTEPISDFRYTKISRDRQNDLLDQALEETFPGSDPISPMCPLSLEFDRIAVR